MHKFIVPLLAAAFLLFGCSTAPDKDSSITEYLVSIDSMTHTPFSSTGDTITLKLYGTLGNDGCCSFSHFEVTQQPLQIDIAAWGTRTSSSMCPEVMMYLDGKEYQLLAIQQGWYHIMIHQPNGSILKDSLLIK